MNYWCIGNAAYNHSTYSLYITNDGTTHYYNYSSGKYSYVWAYVDIDFPTSSSDYTFSFDWMCYGEYDQYDCHCALDYFRAFIGPPVGVEVHQYTAPRCSEQLGDDFRRSNNNWTTYSTTLSKNTYSGTTQRLYFLWRNDNSGGYQYPAAIDNIKIVYTPCEIDDLSFAKDEISCYISATASNTIDVPEGSTISYSSSNTSVATVSTNGVVTGVAEGYAVITATITSGSCVGAADYIVRVSPYDDCSPYYVSGQRIELHDYETYAPIYSNYYSYTQQLYSAEELYVAGIHGGVIRRIGFRYDASQSRTQDIDVYICQTTEDEIPETWIQGPLLQVFSGELNYSENRWYYIEFEQDFEWDGISNIVVAIRNNTSSGASITSWWFSSVTAPYERCAKYDQTSGPVELTSGNYPDESAYGPYDDVNTYTTRPNIKFCMDPCLTPIVTLAHESYIFVEEDDVSAFTNTITYNGGTTLPTGTTYSSSNTSIATVNSSGQVTVDSDNVGTTTITITIPSSDEYCQKVLTYTIQVIDKDLVHRYCVGETAVMPTGTWYDNPEGTGTPVSSISTATAGMITLYKVDVSNFEYTGTVRTYSVPSGVSSLLLEVWGAEGGKGKGNNSTYAGGKGGYSVGTYSVNASTLYVCVGQKGTDGEGTSNVQNGGYNGGGKSGYNSGNYVGGSGGGATHIATATGDLSSLGSNRNAILIVAGGGGGAGESSTGGSGGGLSGGDGSSSSSGKGGTQTDGGAAGTSSTPGAFGKGGNANNQSNGCGIGGGGAGYFGGGAGAYGYTGYSGGGGSGYVGNLTNAQTTAGVNTGNGSARITYKVEYIVIVEDCCDMDAPNVTVACSDRKVTVTWTEVDDADSYTLYYGKTNSQDPNEVVKIENVQNSAQHNTGTHTYQYTVPDLTNGVTYYFSIKAVSDDCESDVAAKTKSPCCN